MPTAEIKRLLENAPLEEARRIKEAVALVMKPFLESVEKDYQAAMRAVADDPLLSKLPPEVSGRIATSHIHDAKNIGEQFARATEEELAEYFGQWDYPPGEEVFQDDEGRDAYKQWASLARQSSLMEGDEEDGKKRPGRTSFPKVIPKPDVLLSPGNSLNAAIVWSLNGPPFPPTLRPGFAVGAIYPAKEGDVFFGVRDGRYTAQLGEYLARGGVQMIKAHYAMWTLWYGSGAKPTGFVTVDVSRLCDLLGYTKHQKGGHRRENKRRAVETITALTEIELQAEYKLPGKGKDGKAKATRLRGPLWLRGLLAEERDEYDDLFGAAREGDDSQWEPKTYSFAPGQWFSDDAFRTYASAVGKIGAGLLELRNDRDEWAIKIGGYLGTIVRANHYAPRVLKVETILQRANVAQTANERRNAGDCKAKFERALDRLAEVSVIKEWGYTDIDATEPDFGDAGALGDYGADTSMLTEGNEWRTKRVLITLPDTFAADTARLAAAAAKQVAAARRRTGNLRKPSAAPD